MLIGLTVRNTGDVILSKLENDDLALKMFYCYLAKYCHIFEWFYNVHMAGPFIWWLMIYIIIHSYFPWNKHKDRGPNNLLVFTRVNFKLGHLACAKKYSI